MRRFLETDQEAVDSKTASEESTDVIYQRTLIQNLRSYQRSRGIAVKGVNLDNQYS